MDDVQKSSSKSSVRAVSDIWNFSQQLSTANHDHLRTERSYLFGVSSLLLVGSQFGGKTSIINRFIDYTMGDKTNKPMNQPEQQYEETIALEYRHVSQRGHHGPLAKVCNIWELGQGLLFTDLIQVVLSDNFIRSLSLILVLDLTRPNEMAILFDSFMEKIRSQLAKILENQPDLSRELESRARKRLTTGHRGKKDKPLSLPDSEQPSNPLPIPLTIIGTRYDEFQNMDPEIKKQISKYLRTMSWQQGGQLFYHSNKSETLTKRIVQALETLAFDSLESVDQDPNPDDTTERSKPAVSTNVTKPLMIPFGMDTLTKIGADRSDQVREEFVRTFPQRDLRQSYSSTMGQDDPSMDPNFSEPEIDKILQYQQMLGST